MNPISRIFCVFQKTNYPMYIEAELVDNGKRKGSKKSRSKMTMDEEEGDISDVKVVNSRGLADALVQHNRYATIVVCCRSYS